MILPILLLLVTTSWDAAKAACPFAHQHGTALHSNSPCPHRVEADSRFKAVSSTVESTGTRAPLSTEFEHTTEGCTCESECTATIFMGSYSKCDWCRTKNSCGKKSRIPGKKHWGYCKYPKVDAFEKQDHTAKMDQIWSEITAEGVVGQSAPYNSVPTVVGTLLTESMRTTFDNKMEVLPRARIKVIHAQGVHCKFTLNVEDSSPYTGIFAPGAQHGIIRMGSASDVNMQLTSGMGLKFFRTGHTSGNFVALRSATPPFEGRTDEKNYFSGLMSNHLPPPRLLQALHKFRQATDCVSMVGLSGLARVTQAGALVDQPIFPFEIEFEPVIQVHHENGDGAEETASHDDEGGLRTSSKPEDPNDVLLAELASIGAGTKLFDVYAYASPKDRHEKTKTKLGTITTTSQCVKSTFGDSRLNFRHQRMEEDFAFRNDWIEELLATDENGDYLYRDSKRDSACTPVSTADKPLASWQCPPL